MDIVVMGAGAVGVVIGTLLEHAGHRVRYWVRPERGAQLKVLSIERVAGPTLLAEAPQLFFPGESVGTCDWVIVCVRGEQLKQALREIVQHMGDQQRVAITTAKLQGSGEWARAVGLTGPVLTLLVAFGSHAEPSAPAHFLWFPFKAPSVVTPDGQRALLPEAKQLARTLRDAGLPTSASLDMSTYTRFMVAILSALGLSWDLCSWELQALPRDSALLQQTARAMKEAVGLVMGSRSALRLIPVWTYRTGIRIAARVMGAEGREVWRHHGPKVRAQNDALVRELLELAPAPPPAALTALFERWQAQCA
jgi:ketopantoate reductase